MERFIIGLLLVAVCLVLGSADAGRLPYPWMKGAAGVALVLIGLYIMYRVYRKSRDKDKS